MLPKTVLFPVHVSQPVAELVPAIEFCRGNAAHLTVLMISVLPSPPVIIDSVSFADIWADDVAAARKELDAARAVWEEKLSAEGISGEVQCEHCPREQIEGATGLYARYADLTLVLASRNMPDGFREHVIAGALFEAARPVLIAPGGKTPELSSQSVLLPWDGNIPASRAASMAIPLLKKARAVCLLCIEPEAGMGSTGEAPGWDAATWLARHGVRASVTTLPDEGKSVATLIRRHASEIGAGLIVAGAYGHSRFRQRLFGGTTSALISDCEVPLLLMH